MICTKCSSSIPNQRWNLGYRTCTNCSTEDQISCIPVTYHKTGNTIEITSKEIAKKVQKESTRSSFGTMRCLKGKKSTTYSPKNTKHQLHIRPIATAEQYQIVLERMINYIDHFNNDQILIELDKLVQKYDLSGQQKSNIIQILEHLTLKKIVSEPIRYRLGKENEPVRSEIDDLFINWKK